MTEKPEVYKSSYDKPVVFSAGLHGSTVVNHLYSVRLLLETINIQAVEKMADAIKSAPLSYVIGNGGSAATATHFAADLAKAAGVRILSLDNLAALTAWTNDEGAINSFSGPLLRLHRNDSEVLVAISTSGQSPNVVRAAREFAGPIIALTGPSGGDLVSASHVHIPVYSEVIEVVEDCHMAICHAVVRLLKDG